MTEASKYGEVIDLIYRHQALPDFTPSLQWERFFVGLAKIIDDNVADCADLGSQGSWLKASLLEFVANVTVTPTMRYGAQQFFRKQPRFLQDEPYRRFVGGLEAICHSGYIHGPASLQKLHDILDTARMDVLWVRHLKGLDGDQQ